MSTKALLAREKFVGKHERTNIQMAIVTTGNER